MGSRAPRYEGAHAPKDTRRSCHTSYTPRPNFGTLTDPATAHRSASLAEFIGDGIMIFFGDPESKGHKEDALACVRMALAMRTTHV